MQVGYARVSTSEQSLAVQLDALQHHGCTKIFQEVASGAQAERQGLTAALAYVRPGDTLVVWRLDRLGRSLGQLIILMNTLHQQQIGFQRIFPPIQSPRRLSTKQAVGLVRPELPHGRCQAIIAFSAYDASMTRTLGER